MYHHRSLVRPLGVALFGGRSDPLEKRIITAVLLSSSSTAARLPHIAEAAILYRLVRFSVLEHGSTQSAFAKDVLEAAFQMYAALAQRPFAKLAFNGTRGAMKSQSSP
jgi:hypothetical protein